MPPRQAITLLVLGAAQAPLQAQDLGASFLLGVFGIWLLTAPTQISPHCREVIPKPQCLGLPQLWATAPT